MNGVVRPPGSDGQGSTARSLSGRPISNITQLIEEDLHTFNEGYFTFRFLAALAGSGKTTLLTYLHELTKTKPNYQGLFIAVQFQLSDLLTASSTQSFSIKLYCYILAQTFWELLHNQNLSSSVKNVAEHILNERLESFQFNQLKAANTSDDFYEYFKEYFTTSGVVFEKFLFYVISKVVAIEPKFPFVYLLDELDTLQEFYHKIKERRFVFKQLIRRAFQQYSSNIRILIYLVGTSNNVKGFINGDSILASLVDGCIIDLHGGYSNEFEMIRAKIDERIKGYYKGYKEFDKPWQEIKSISLAPANNLSKFCRDYAGSVLGIHGKYFEEAPEQGFEGNARQLVEAQCRQQWASYLNKAGYTLSAVPTTTVLAGHAFDCYVELLHNDNPVARAFGEAKNYELLSGHLQTFEQWLNDVIGKRLLISSYSADSRNAMRI